MAFLTLLFRINGRQWLIGRQRWHAQLAVLCMLFFSAQPGSAEESAMANEKALKVAFLYNFALYTEWPTPLVEGLTLCISGRDDLGAALETLAGRQINGKPIILRRLDARAETGGCHMIYVAASGDTKSTTLSIDLRQKSVLSVKDAASAESAMISLGRDGNRLFFDIDNTNARAAGLLLSSKLLRLARSVR